jgi:hypothetical protein
MPLDKLGVVFLSRNWARVRGISVPGWLNIPYAYFDDLVGIARSYHFKWEEFLLLLLYGVDPNYDSWREDWWVERLPGFDEIAVRISDRFPDFLESEFLDKHHQEEDEEKDPLVNRLAARSNARPHRKLRSPLLATEVDWVVENIIPGLDLSPLAAAATPWDRQRWERGDF